MEEGIARAGQLIQWIETALAVAAGNPRVFADLDTTGLEQARRFLRHRFIPELKTGHALPPVVLICGGTNTGKSTLVNSFAGQVVSPTGGGVASYTKRLIAVGPAPSIEACLAAREEWQLLPYARIKAPENPFLTLYERDLADWPAGLPIFLDTPDIDSSDTTCRRHSLLALAFPDLILWVTTQQKYKDRSGMTFLDEAMGVVKARLDVFNQFLPRQVEAFEDLKEYYQGRWPDNDAVQIRVPEAPNLGEEGILGESYLEPLRAELSRRLQNPFELKKDNLRHGLRQVGRRLTRDARRLLARRQECLTVREDLHARFDDTLFLPIYRLEGNAQPFELQAALVRALKPRLENVFSMVVDSVDTSVRSLAGWAFSLLRGGGTRVALPEANPVQAREHSDLAHMQKILEDSRFAVLELIRREAAAGNLLFTRLHAEMRTFTWPASLTDPAALQELYDRRYQEKMVPLFERFEQDLVKFCEENPTLLAALRATVPGLSVLAALAAAVFSIHVFTILPGVTEYLLGGVAYPIFRKLQNALPGKLVTLANELSRNPFILQARKDFTDTRAAIFREMGRSLTEPVLSVITVAELTDLDVPMALKRLERSWKKGLQNLAPAGNVAAATVEETHEQG